MSETGARENPYVGPRSIRTGERLYGREREEAQLFNLLLAERIVLLYSPSGAGKSSLLNAGLLPRLREEGFRIRPTMRVGMEPPIAAPAGANRHVLSALLSLYDDATDDAKDGAKDGEFDLARLAGQTLASYLEREDTDDPDIAEVLVIDQFEEILTTAPADITSKRAFFAQLGEALRDERLWLIIAMREDFIAGLDPYRGALPTGLRTTFRLDLPDTKAALAAIKGPAAAAGVAFSEVAAEKLANDLREVRVQQADGSVVSLPGPHVEPVQLQVVCRSLWQQLRPEDREIGLENLARLGDVDAALATYYDTQVEAAAQRCALPERALRQWIGAHLVTANGLRTQVLQTPIRTQGLDNAALTALVDAHLLRTDTRRGMTWIELAHDRIIKPLQASNARWFQAKLSPVQRQAELWHSRGRPEGLLLTSHEEASRLLAVEEARPDSEREFLEQSKVVRLREAVAARNRRLLRLSIVVIVVIVVAWLCVGYVMLQRQAEREREAAMQQARLAEQEQAAAAEQLRLAEVENRAAEEKLTRQLVAQVALHRESQPELAALLGVAASSRLAAAWQRKAALINIGVTAPELVARLSLGVSGGADSAGRPGAAYPWKVAARAQQLFAADRGGQIWRIAQGQRAVPLLKPEIKAVDFAVHPSEPLLAIGGTGTTITLWNHAIGEVRATIELPGEARPGGKKAWVEGLAFSANGGTLLAVQSVEGRSPAGFVVDVATHIPRELGIFSGLEDPSVLALSADGKIVVWAIGSLDTIAVFSGTPFKRSVVKLACTGRCPMYVARFSPGGSRLLTGGDGALALWNVDSRGVGKTLRVVPLGAGETVRDALFIDDDKLAVLTDRRISRWSGATLEPWGTPIELGSSGVQGLARAGEEGELIAAVSNTDAPVSLFEPDRLAPRGMTLVAADPTEGLNAPFEHARVLAALDPSGRTLATTDFEVKTTPAGSGAVKRTQSFGHVTLHDSTGPAPAEVLTPLEGEQFAALRFTRGGARLVVADVGGRITAWDVAAKTWTALGTLPIRGDLITLGASETGEILATVRSPDGLFLGREGDGFTAMMGFGDAAPAAVAIDGRGRRLALATCMQETKPGVCSWSVINIHDVDAPAAPPRQRLELGFEPARLVFSADGERLACSDGERIQAWNLADGAPLPLAVRQGLGVFNGLDLSADGQVLVASANVDKTAAVDLVLWHLDTGEELAPPLRVHNPAITGATLGQVLISADNNRIVSSTCDGAVVWDIDDETLRSRACALAGRELTPAEQQRFLGSHPYQPLCPTGR